MKKIFTLSRFKKILSLRENKKIVFFSGAFDLFHYGHFRALLSATTLGDLLVVQVDGDRLVRKRKGLDRPHISEIERVKIISSFEFVDYVIISNIPSESKQTLNSIKPDVFVRAILSNENGYDRVLREKKIVKRLPFIKVVWLKQTPEISTSKIIKMMKTSTSRDQKIQYEQLIHN